jgi:hypothetical protein
MDWASAPKKMLRSSPKVSMSTTSPSSRDSVPNADPLKIASILLPGHRSVHEGSYPIIDNRPTGKNNSSRDTAPVRERTGETARRWFAGGRNTDHPVGFPQVKLNKGRGHRSDHGSCEDLAQREGRTLPDSELEDQEINTVNVRPWNRRALALRARQAKSEKTIRKEGETNEPDPAAANRLC